MKKALLPALALALLAAAPSAAQANPTVRPQDQAPCRDPWINIAVREVTRERAQARGTYSEGRAPSGRHESGECNIHLYGASWNSYAELKGFVHQAFRGLDTFRAHLDEQGNLTLSDDYQQISAPAARVRVVSRRGVTDGAGNRVSDDGSQLDGSMGIGNGVVIRFPRR